MATLDTDEANLIDAEAVNWRLIVFPILALLVVVIGGLGYYYYTQDQRDQAEATARAALLQAKTPEEFIKVADQYPNTTQAVLALMSAADASFTKHDYTAAIAAYQRITQNSATDPGLRDSAQLGLASCLEASGKAQDAINAFLEVAQLGAKSPNAPFAYYSAARIYEDKGDKENERRILSEGASLSPDSPFVKQIQQKLNELNAASKPAASASVPTTISSTPTPASAASAAPAPTMTVTPAVKPVATPAPVPPTSSK